MRRITKYILKNLFLSASITSSVLIGSLWIIQSLKFIKIVLRSQESFSAFFHLFVFSLPDLLVIVLPITTFISVLFVYSRLHTDRELLSSFAAGYNEWEIVRPALGFASAIMILIYGLNIFVVPWSFQQIRDLEAKLKNSLPGILLQEGVFNVFNEVTIYVNEKDGSDLRGVLAHIHKKNERPFTIMAREGRLIVKDKIPRIIMEDGNRQELKPESNSLSILYFDQTLIPLSEGPQKLVDRQKKPYELTLEELFYEDHGNIGASYRQRLYAEGYQRLLSPWYVVGFVSIALSFLVMAKFKRNSQGSAILKAAIGALLLQTFCLSLLSMGAHFWYAIVLAYLTMGGTILLCVLILQRKINKIFFWNLRKSHL